MSETYAGHTAEALRALAAAATPGPWVSFAHEPDPLYTVASVGGGPDAAIEEICREPEGDERAADMAFIAAARLALPAALDRVAALEAENARLREALGELAAYCGNSDNWHRPVEARAMIEVMIDNALAQE